MTGERPISQPSQVGIGAGPATLYGIEVTPSPSGLLAVISSVQSPWTGKETTPANDVGSWASGWSSTSRDGVASVPGPGLTTAVTRPALDHDRGAPPGRARTVTAISCAVRGGSRSTLISTMYGPACRCSVRSTVS